MGFRFRRSIRILPGVRVNLGKRGASVSVGGRGAHVTLRPGHKARATVGLPGTGLSYSHGGQIEHRPAPGGQARPPRDASGFGWLLAAVVLAIMIGLVLHNSP